MHQTEHDQSYIRELEDNTQERESYAECFHHLKYRFNFVMRLAYLFDQWFAGDKGKIANSRRAFTSEEAIGVKVCVALYFRNRFRMTLISPRKCFGVFQELEPRRSQTSPRNGARRGGAERHAEGQRGRRVVPGDTFRRIRGGIPENPPCTAVKARCDELHGYGNGKESFL